MQNPHILDAIIVTTTTTAAAALAVADPGSASDAIELRLVLLPLIGAMIISGGLIILNPQIETRRIVIGRAIFALFFGVVSPQVICAIWTSLAPFAAKPMPLLLLGGLIAGGAYVISKPFCNELYKRAEGVARQQADRLEALIDKKTLPPGPPANS